MNDARISRVLNSYGIDADPDLCGKIQLYITLLSLWNQKISLSGVRDPEEMLRFHFGESFSAARWITPEPRRLVDLGSGAGFPGLALKLIRPHLSVTLIEPSTKKAAFLAEICRQLDLRSVEVVRSTFGELKEGEFDFIVSRALGHYDDMLEWSRAHLAARGSIILWLGFGQVGELRRHDGWEWSEPLHLLDSERRVILKGTRS